MSFLAAGDRPADCFDRPQHHDDRWGSPTDRRFPGSSNPSCSASSSSSSSSFSSAAEPRRRRRSRSMRDRSPSAPAAMAVFPVGDGSDDADEGRRCYRRRKSSAVRAGVLGLGLGGLAGLGSNASDTTTAGAGLVRDDTDTDTGGAFGPADPTSTAAGPPTSSPIATATDHDVFRRQRCRRRSTVEFQSSVSDAGSPIPPPPPTPLTTTVIASAEEIEDVVMQADVSTSADAATVVAGLAIPCSVALPVTAESSLQEPADAPIEFPLGQPTLRVAFCQEEGEEDVPPCFYPGQTIPTTLLFELPRYTTLAHALRPELTMSLVGVLRVLRPTDGRETNAAEENNIVERSLINVGVSLEEGLQLWAKDAGAAWMQLSERRQRGRANPAVGLPGGKYTLPLTVQVPTHPRLPPSFRLPGSIFEIVYALEVSLTIDRTSPAGASKDESDRVQLVRTSREFTLLPTTLPSQPPVLPPLDGLLDVPLPAPAAGLQTPSSVAAASQSLVGLGISAPAGWMDKLQQAFVPLRSSLGGHLAASDGGASGSRSRSHSPGPPPSTFAVSAASAKAAAEANPSWSVQPSLSTSAFSPSSNIPLDLMLVAPLSASLRDTQALPEGQLLVKASILRREHAFSSRSAPSKLEETRGLVHEEEIVSASGAFDLSLLLPTGSPTTKTVKLPRLDLPLGFGPLAKPWASGMTTSLTVSPDPMQAEDFDGQAHLHTHCSSRFYLALQVAYLPSTPNTSTTGSDQPTNDFQLNRPLFIPSVLRSRSLLIPITIGSVGEPSGARHRRTWRELYLATNERTGEEAPRMVSGSAVDDERGWLLPPPSYETALGEREYIL